MNLPDLPDDLAASFGGRLGEAVRIACLGGHSTLDVFQSSQLAVERKGDDSPVTIADKKAETMMRDALGKVFPEDAVLGEEFGESQGSTEFQWIVDPIDGTKSFISGVPLYSTLVGVVSEGQCLVGVIYIPALNELIFAGRGLGAWHSDGGTWKQARVSSRNLSDGLFVVSQRDSFDDRGAWEGFKQLEKIAYVTRTWGDGYGYLLVATGRAELMIDPIGNPWDLAAVQPVIEEAGGIFSDWQGNRSAFGGDGVGANPESHAQAMKILNS